MICIGYPVLLCWGGLELGVHSFFCFAFFLFVKVVCVLLLSIYPDSQTPSKLEKGDGLHQRCRCYPLTTYSRKGGGNDKTDLNNYNGETKGGWMDIGTSALIQTYVRTITRLPQSVT